MKKTLIILFIIGLVITIFCSIGAIQQFKIENEKSKETSVNYHKVYDQDHINKLDVDLEKSNVTIQKGDQFKVESRGIKGETHMNTNVKNGTLYVKDKALDNKSDISFLDFEHNHVVVTLPKSLDHLDVNTYSGSIKLDSVYADYAKLYADVSELTIQNSEFDRLISKVDVANVHIAHTQFNSGEFASDTGNFEIDDMPADKPINVKTDVGNVSMKYGDQRPKNTRVAFESDIGELTINDRLFKNKQVGNGRHLIHIETDTGNAEIN